MNKYTINDIISHSKVAHDNGAGRFLVATPELDLNLTKLLAILNSLQEQVDGLKGKAEPIPEDWEEEFDENFHNWTIYSPGSPAGLQVKEFITTLLDHEKEKVRKEERAKVLAEVRKGMDGITFHSAFTNQNLKEACRIGFTRAWVDVDKLITRLSQDT